MYHCVEDTCLRKSSGCHLLISNKYLYSFHPHAFIVDPEKCDDRNTQSYAGQAA